MITKFNLSGFGQGPRTNAPAGRGRGRQPGGRGLGPAGFCVCPQCGEKVAHRRGVPCYEIRCPKCGSPMTREG